MNFNCTTIHIRNQKKCFHRVVSVERSIQAYQYVTWKIRYDENDDDDDEDLARPVGVRELFRMRPHYLQSWSFTCAFLHGPSVSDWTISMCFWWFFGGRDDRPTSCPAIVTSANSQHIIVYRRRVHRTMHRYKKPHIRCAKWTKTIEKYPRPLDLTSLR